MLKSLQNIGEYFSTNYFDEEFTLKVQSIIVKPRCNDGQTKNVAQ